jgi:hypothetical protein
MRNEGVRFPLILSFADSSHLQFGVIPQSVRRGGSFLVSHPIDEVNGPAILFYGSVHQRQFLKPCALRPLLAKNL